MKISDNFSLRNIAGEYMVVPLGIESVRINGLINLNDTGAFLWNELKEEKEESDLVKALLNEYNIDEETAEKDVKGFIKILKDAGIL